MKVKLLVNLKVNKTIYPKGKIFDSELGGIPSDIKAEVEAGTVSVYIFPESKPVKKPKQVKKPEKEASSQDKESKKEITKQEKTPEKVVPKLKPKKKKKKTTKKESGLKKKG